MSAFPSKAKAYLVDGHTQCAKKKKDEGKKDNQDVDDFFSLKGPFVNYVSTLRYLVGWPNAN